MIAYLAHIFHSPTGSSRDYNLAQEFRDAAAQWRVIAERQWQDAKAATDREPTPQVFRAGDPADVNNEAFIERTGVIGDIAAQLELATGCPGLVL